MSATAARSPVAGGDEGSGSSLSVLRTKRMIALLRICVLAVVMVVSLSSVGIRTDAGPEALPSCCSTPSSTRWRAWFLSRRGEASPWSRTATVAIDVALITAWIEVTGGGRSEFWTLYLIVIAAVALRFGIVETVGVAVGLAVLLTTKLVRDGVLWTSRLYRPTPAAGRGVRGRGALAAARGPATEAVRDGGDRGIEGASSSAGSARGGAPAQGGSGADRVRRGRGARAQDPARGDPRGAEHPQGARCGARGPASASS